MARLELDPWQEFVLANGLNERENGWWAAFEVAMMVARQNGKGTCFEGRELAGLFLLEEELITHTAHQFKTSLEAFRRLLMRIEDTPDFDRRVQRVSKTHGEEGIELKKNRRTGRRQRILFQTRTKGAGIGFSGDCLVLDEDMFLDEDEHGALLPTLSARPNPQVWYGGSAPDQARHDGRVKARLRRRALAGGDGALMYVEWSPDLEARLAERGVPFEAGEVGPDDVDDEWAADPRVVAEANPGLGIRISLEHVARERRSMHRRKFAVERLGIPDLPPVEDEEVERAITAEEWRAVKDRHSRVLDPVCLAFDLRRDRSAAAIGIAGARRDRLEHVEVVEHAVGVGWVVPRVVELVKRHRPVGVLCEANSPAMALVASLKRLGVEVRVVRPSEAAQACGMVLDGVSNGGLRHLGSRELDDALAGARLKAVGDSWAWSRKASLADISPLVAVTLALWGWRSRPQAGVLRAEDYRIVAL